MDLRFTKFIKVVLANEGGLSNDISDKGGLTKYGISQRAFPGLDIKNLTLATAAQIYYDQYYLPMSLGKITNDELALHLFDMGVNAGTKMAVKLLQKLYGLVQDGILGNMTAGAANADPCAVDSYKEARREYYKQIANNGSNQKFLQGWLNRVNNTKLS